MATVLSSRHLAAHAAATRAREAMRTAVAVLDKGRQTTAHDRAWVALTACRDVIDAIEEQGHVDECREMRAEWEAS